MKTCEQRKSSAGLGPVSKPHKIKLVGMIDKPGEFLMIEKEELYCDFAYQRDKRNERKINNMALNWSWVLCNTLAIAIRRDVWYVLDGFSRKLAADKRDDIKKLPCMVYELEGREVEAIMFVRLNCDKTHVKSFNKFRALIFGKDETAVELEKLFQSTGHIAAYEGGIKSIECLMTIWKTFATNREIVKSIWPILAEVNHDCQINGQIFTSFYWTEIALRRMNMNKTLNVEPIRTFLIKKGGPFINSAITKEINICGFGGKKTLSNALIKHINKENFRGIAKIPLWM
jgi:hypothetical protein